MSAGGRVRVREVEIRSKDGVAERERLQRRRLLVRIGAVAVVVLAIGALFERPGAPAAASSYGKGPGDFWCLARTLENLDYPVDRHRASYGRLVDPEHSVLLTLDPLPAETLNALGVPYGVGEPLRDFVESGGNLVLALPVRQRVSVFGFDVWLAVEDRDESPWLAPIEPYSIVVETREALVDLRDSLGGRASRPIDDAAHRLLPGSLGVDEEPRTLAVRVFDEDAVPNGAKVRARYDGAPVAIELGLGQGRIVVFSSPLWLTNAALGRLDTTRFAVDLVHDLSEDGRRRIFFDEFAHGLFVTKGLWGVLWSSSLRIVLLAIVGFAVLWAWRGAFRLTPDVPERDRPRRAVEEFLVSLGDLARRGGRHRGAALRLLRAHEVEAVARGDQEALRAFAALRADVEATRAFALRGLTTIEAEIRAILDRNGTREPIRPPTRPPTREPAPTP